MAKVRMKRIQGQAWHDIKADVEVLGYYEGENTHRIKVFTRLMGGPVILYHWLNDRENAKFQNHKHKYPLMNDSAEIVEGVRK